MFRKLAIFTKECEIAPSFAVKLFLSRCLFHKKFAQMYNDVPHEDEKTICNDFYWNICDFLEKEHKYYMKVWHRNFWSKLKLHFELKRTASIYVSDDDAIKYVIYLAKMNKLIIPEDDLYRQLEGFPVIYFKDIAPMSKECAKNYIEKVLLTDFPTVQTVVDEIKANGVDYLSRHRINRELNVYHRLKNKKRLFIFAPIVNWEIKKRGQRIITLGEFISWAKYV